MTDISNKHFCIVPWTHTFLSPQCERRLCCSSREEHQYIAQYSGLKSSDSGEKKFSPLTLKEHWNSDFMKSIRKRMLKGEKILECQICDEKNKDEISYRDYFTENLFPHLIEYAYESTDSDGETSMTPRSFDYRLDNRCNFKCRMCGDQLSSAWEDEKNKSKQLDPKADLWMQAKIKSKLVQFQKDVAFPEFKDAVLSGDVEEIYWVGGEPLIWDYHWEIMKLLVDNDLAKDIFVRYNTNLSVIEKNGLNLFTDILPHFKNYMIQASIDSTGKVGEYLRTGLNWNVWLENFNVGLKNTAEDTGNTIQMDLTITLPGLFGIYELVKLSYELDSKIITKLVYDFDPSILLSPLALPRKTLDTLLNNLIKKIVPFTTQKNKSVLNTLLKLKKLKTFEERHPETFNEAFNKGRKYLLYLEELRNDNYTLNDIYKENEQVFNWWTKENES